MDTCLLHADFTALPWMDSRNPADENGHTSTCPWMDTCSRMITDMAVPSQGYVPAVDGIARYPDRSRGATTGMPADKGLRSDSLQEDWHEYAYC